MKNLKKLIVGMCVLVVLSTSCNRPEEEVKVLPVSTVCTQLSQTFGQGDYSSYDLDEKGRVSKINYFVDNNLEAYTTIEWNLKNKPQRLSNVSNDKVITSVHIEYNAKGNWDKATFTGYNTTKQKVLTASYDNNGNRASISTKYMITGKVLNTTTTTFVYQNGNLVSSNISDEISKMSTSYEFFSDKENKLYAFEELFSFLGNGAGNKNVLRKKLYENNTAEEYSYDFDEKGNVVKTYTILKSGNEMQSLVTSTAYSCN